MQRVIVGFFLIVVVILCFQPSFAEDVSGRVSVTDKEIIERLTRLEEGQKALNQRIDDVSQRIDDVNTSLSSRIDDVSQRIDAVNTSLSSRIDDVGTHLTKRIDDLQGTMHWGFGILFAMILGLFGYIVWDRRTALQPVLEKTRNLENLLDALREYARSEPRLAEILRSFGLF